MRISIIIASRNRREQLLKTLQRFPMPPMQRASAELVLVDSASEDGTEGLMQAYAQQAPFPVRVVRAPEPGLAFAQNVGIEASTGDLLVFTDDDCYLADDYIEILGRKFDASNFQYGMGEVHLISHDDDPRVANTMWWSFPERHLIPPRSFVAPGMIQGANMFFLRDVLAATGGIRQVGPLDNNDVMTAYMASRHGFTGVMLRGPIVHHDHGRKRDSAEAQRTSEGYATTAGSYYAQLLAIGRIEAFDFWKATVPRQSGARDLRKLEIELRAAADEMAWLIASQRSAEPQEPPARDVLAAA